jgi:aryl-alcohol dehydrogenase-like predicted oxidoreductase
MEDGGDRGLRRGTDPPAGRVEACAGLGVERIPLYLAHAFDPPTSRRRRRSRRSTSSSGTGRSERVGASNFSAEQLAEALEISALEGLTRYEWVQNAFSLLEQGDRETIFPALPRARARLHAVRPLAGGWLTGKYRRGEEPPPGRA